MFSQRRSCGLDLIAMFALMFALSDFGLEYLIISVLRLSMFIEPIFVLEPHWANNTCKLIGIILLLGLHLLCSLLVWMFIAHVFIKTLWILVRLWTVLAPMLSVRDGFLDFSDIYDLIIFFSRFDFRPKPISDIFGRPNFWPIIFDSFWKFIFSVKSDRLTVKRWSWGSETHGELDLWLCWDWLWHWEKSSFKSKGGYYLLLYIY